MSIENEKEIIEQIIKDTKPILNNTSSLEILYAKKLLWEFLEFHQKMEKGSVTSTEFAQFVVKVKEFLTSSNNQRFID